MSHLVLQIRDALKSQLTGKTDAGNNVFTARVSKMEDSELPAILIFINGDTVAERSADNYQPQEQLRKLEVGIVVTAKQEDGYEDTVYKIAGQIEQAVMENWRLGIEQIHGNNYIGCELSNFGEGEQNASILSMNWEIDFICKEGKLL